MFERTLLLVAVLALAACSGDDESAKAPSGDHFAKEQKKALDEAAKVGDKLRDAAKKQKDAAGG